MTKYLIKIGLIFTSINSFGDLLIQDFFNEIMEVQDFFNHYKENFKIELLAQGC